MDRSVARHRLVIASILNISSCFFFLSSRYCCLTASSISPLLRSTSVSFCLLRLRSDQLDSVGWLTQFWLCKH